MGPLSAQAQMYKCVDERGVTHYMDQPLPGCKGRQVDIGPLPPVSGSVAPPAENPPQQDADFKRRQSERERAEREERAALERRCSSLRQERARLSSGRRLVEINEKGERTFVEDATRERRLAGLQGAMRDCP